MFDPVVIYEPPDGTPLGGVGQVMSYYEFAPPGWGWLAGAEWHPQVLSGTPPARPWWVMDLLDVGEGRK